MNNHESFQRQKEEIKIRWANREWREKGEKHLDSSKSQTWQIDRFPYKFSPHKGETLSDDAKRNELGTRVASAMDLENQPFKGGAI